MFNSLVAKLYIFLTQLQVVQQVCLIEKVNMSILAEGIRCLRLSLQEKFELLTDLLQTH